jgi:hypothetical protein
MKWLRRLLISEVVVQLATAETGLLSPDKFRWSNVPSPSIRHLPRFTSSRSTSHRKVNGSPRFGQPKGFGGGCIGPYPLYIALALRSQLRAFPAQRANVSAPPWRSRRPE